MARLAFAKSAFVSDMACLTANGAIASSSSACWPHDISSFLE
jgi:hypothetical protein